MNIMELGAIGELVGGVAVIASLIYVGLQVRHSAQATRAASYQATVDSFRDWSQSMIGGRRGGRPLPKGQHRPGHPVADRIRAVQLLLFGVIRIYETLFYQSETGTGERRLLRSEEGSLRWLMANPAVQEWWRNTPWTLNDEFSRYIDSFLPATSQGAEA